MKTKPHFMLFILMIGLLFGFRSSVSTAQQILIAPIQVSETGKFTTDVFTRAEDSDLTNLFQPLRRPEKLLSGARLLQNASIRGSLEVSDQQFQKIRDAQSELTKSSRENMMTELNEFSAIREQLIKKGADENEVKQFMAAELKKMHEELGRKNSAGFNRVVLNVLSEDQVTDLDSLTQRVLLIQAGLDGYLTNKRVVDQVFETESRRKNAVVRINELSDRFDKELKKLKLKYQREMIDSLNSNEQESITGILDLSISKLKSEVIGRSMLLKDVEKQ